MQPYYYIVEGDSSNLHSPPILVFCQASKGCIKQWSHFKIKEKSRRNRENRDRFLGDSVMVQKYQGKKQKKYDKIETHERLFFTRLGGRN